MARAPLGVVEARARDPLDAAAPLGPLISTLTAPGEQPRMAGHAGALSRVHVDEQSSTLEQRPRLASKWTPVSSCPCV